MLKINWYQELAAWTIIVLISICLAIMSTGAVFAEDDYPIVPPTPKPVVIPKPVAKPVITVDKVQATISVHWPDTGKTVTQPALLGRSKSNKLYMEVYDGTKLFNHITPAGQFTTTKMYSWRLEEDMLVFIKGTVKLAAIHPLWNGNPDQRRVQRLKSETPTDNRVTSGCINVDSDFFYAVLNTLPDGTVVNILPE
jgi:hypothetical protein